MKSILILLCLACIQCSSNALVEAEEGSEWAGQYYLDSLHPESAYLSMGKSGTYHLSFFFLDNLDHEATGEWRDEGSSIVFMPPLGLGFLSECSSLSKLSVEEDRFLSVFEIDEDLGETKFDAFRLRFVLGGSARHRELKYQATQEDLRRMGWSPQEIEELTFLDPHAGE